MRGGAWRRQSGQARAGKPAGSVIGSGQERQMKGGNHQNHKRQTAAQILNEHCATGFAVKL